MCKRYIHIYITSLHICYRHWGACNTMPLAFVVPHQRTALPGYLISIWLHPWALYISKVGHSVPNLCCYQKSSIWMAYKWNHCTRCNVRSSIVCHAEECRKTILFMTILHHFSMISEFFQCFTIKFWCYLVPDSMNSILFSCNIVAIIFQFDSVCFNFLGLFSESEQEIHCLDCSVSSTFMKLTHVFLSSVTILLIYLSPFMSYCSKNFKAVANLWLVLTSVGCFGTHCPQNLLKPNLSVMIFWRVLFKIWGNCCQNSEIVKWCLSHTICSIF